MKAHDTERLSAYYDGALAGLERATVEAHLRTCDACADYLADLAALDEGARGLPAEAPAGYFEQFPSKVRARMKGGRPRRWTPVWVGAAAAAVLLAVLTPHMLSQKSVAPGTATRSSDELPRAAAPAPPAGAAPPATAVTQAQPAAPPERLREAAPAPRVQESGPVPKKLETGEAPAPAKDDGAAFAPPPAAPPPAAASGGMAGGVAGGVVGGVPGAAPEPQAMTEKAKRQTSAEEADRRDLDAARDEEQGARAEQKVADKPVDKLAANEAPAPVGRAAPAASAGLAKSAVTSTAEEARAARERWRTVAQRDPQHADEARYRTVEEGARAWRLGTDPHDRAIAVADARAYLAKPGEHSTRVRELLAELER